MNYALLNNFEVQNYNKKRTSKFIMNIVYAFFFYKDCEDMKMENI